MKLTKKMIIAGAGAVGAVGIGSAAFAFFNTSASGGGTVNVTSTLQPVTLTGGLSSNALIPNSPVAVLISVRNPNNAEVRLGPITMGTPHVGTGPTDLTSLDATCPLVPGGAAAGPYTVGPNANGLNLVNTFTLTLGNAAEEQSPCLTGYVTFSLNA